MPLIDQNGKKLRIDRPPQYDVKIVASRREIVWNDNHEDHDPGNDDRNQDIKAEENKNPGVIDHTDPEITDDKSARIEPFTKNKTKRRKVINNHNRRPPVNTKNFQGKLLKSKSDDEITRRKTSTSSFTILSSKSNHSSNSKVQGKQSERSVDFNNPVELDRAVAEDMGDVSSRNMDLMIMEMRKLDRDRDRVLIPNTVKTTLEKFHIPVQPAAREVLLENFQDKTKFIGMVNYEELVRYLE